MKTNTKAKRGSPVRVNPIVRLPRCVLEALEAASEALDDLGACDDPQCRDENCNHAITKVRDVLAEQKAERWRSAGRRQPVR